MTRHYLLVKRILGVVGLLTVDYRRKPRENIALQRRERSPRYNRSASFKFQKNDTEENPFRAESQIKFRQIMKSKLPTFLVD